MMVLSPTIQEVCLLQVGTSTCLLFLMVNPRVVVFGLAAGVLRVGFFLKMPMLKIRTAAEMRVLMNTRAKS